MYECLNKKKLQPESRQISLIHNGKESMISDHKNSQAKE